MNEPSTEQKLDAALRIVVQFLSQEGFFPYDTSIEDQKLVLDEAERRNIEPKETWV